MTSHRALAWMLGAVVAWGACSPCWADPSIQVTTTRDVVQKGGEVDVIVQVSARETIRDILIAPSIPYGFVAEPLRGPGYAVDSLNVMIPFLREGSSISVRYRAWPPKTVPPPNMTDKDHYGNKVGHVSTAEPKPFVFNVFYSVSGDSILGASSQTVRASIRYTTSLGAYLLSGVLGVLLGYLIKAGRKGQDAVLQEQRAASSNLRGFIEDRLGVTAAGLVTSLVLGFGILTVLAREGIPVNGGFQAIALGIGLAVLTDDELLSKLRGKR